MKKALPLILLCALLLTACSSGGTHGVSGKVVELNTGPEGLESFVMDSNGELLGVTLTDTQINQLISLCRSLEKLNPDELKAKVESVQNTIAKLGQAKETVSTFLTGVKNVWNSIVDFFKNIFG